MQSHFGSPYNEGLGSESMTVLSATNARQRNKLASLLLLVLATVFCVACGSKRGDEVANADSSTTSDASKAQPNGPTGSSDTAPSKAMPTKLRVATFNVSFYRKQAGELVSNLASGNDDDAHRIAHILQTVRPDIVLLNEFDYDENDKAIQAFREQYLAVGHDDAEPIEYAHYYNKEVNTGVPSGVDLDNDGANDGWNDCYGFGRYPGQYGMVVLSKYPIDADATRTFQKLLWSDMKDANVPIDPKTGESFYSEEAWKVFRISSKSHWDVAIDVEGTPLHFIVSHPTPPVFDGPEDRNGKRNHDEIRLIADYISNDPHGYIVDDSGTKGGLAAGSHFVIAGDLNADPNDGASFKHAIRQLTDHDLVQSSLVPSSDGSLHQANTGANADHTGDPHHDTADFDDRRTGNLRADYVLPSNTLKVQDTGVFWPKPDEPGAELVNVTDHRLVWVDLEL